MDLAFSLFPQERLPRQDAASLKAYYPLKPTNAIASCVVYYIIAPAHLHLTKVVVCPT